MKNPVWEMQEKGWWTKKGVGGVCKEADGRWHAYPHSSPCDHEFASCASFTTMREATEYLDGIK